MSYSMKAVWIISLGLFLLSGHTACADTLSETDEILYNTGDATIIREKAEKLGNVMEIYDYVRNNYGYAPYHGAHNDSLGAFRAIRANDVDLATLLIAMLRSQGIPSRYVVGKIRVKTDRVMSWLGVTNPELARNILMNNVGLQTASFYEGQAYLDFDHVWVEALVSYGNYRGAGPDASADCTAQSSQCQWIPLDPSFKLNSFKDTAIDIHDRVECNFDYNAYYGAMRDGNEGLTNKNPLEIFEEQVLSYLKSAHPGKNLEDVSTSPRINASRHAILPASLPYEVVSTISRFDSVAEHDLAFPDPPWTKMLSGTITLQGDPNDPIDLQFSMKLSKLSAKPFSLTFDLQYSTYKYIDMNLGEEVYWFEIPASYPHMQEGMPFRLALTLDLYPWTDVNATYEYGVVGGQYLVATGGSGSGYLQLQAAKERLLALNDQYPVVNGPEVPSLPYVDVNRNGEYDGGDIKLIDHYEANKWMTNGLLYTAQTLYYAKLNDYVSRTAALYHSIAPIGGFLGVLSTTPEVEYLDNTPFAIMPGGLLIDVKEQLIDSPWRIAQPQTTSEKAYKLIGHIGSSLEHEIWQELTGYDAISTVRGIQMALANSAQLAQINYQTMANSYPALGFSDSPVLNGSTYNTEDLTGGRLGFWYPQFRKKIRGYWGWLSPTYPDLSMEVIKKTVDASTSSLHRLVAIYPFSTTSNLTNAIDSNFANLYGLYTNTSSTVTNWNTDRHLWYPHYPNDAFEGTFSNTYYDFVDDLPRNPGPLGDNVYFGHRKATTCFGNTLPKNFTIYIIIRPTSSIILTSIKATMNRSMHFA